MNSHRPTPPEETTGAARPTRLEHGGMEYWRVERVARYLDISRKRVYQLVQEGRLIAVHLSPRTTRIVRQSIDALLAELAAREADS